ncbi:AAA family ATPase [Pectobacterium parmentieri]|nr:AAA family ATPase [Pectobacterium parmentieri]AOR59277.1 hypothetical protein A8F97_10185 [Pectobacterium parmentieri]
MYKISSVRIYGLWGEKTLNFKFDDDVNILIGINGTGKTTVINILYSILNAKSEIISKCNFDKITIHLEDEGNPFSTKVIYAARFGKNEDGYDKEVYYDIDGEGYLLVPDESKRLIYNRTKDVSPAKASIVSEEQLNKIIKEIINVVGISTNRSKIGDENSNDDAFFSDFLKSSVVSSKNIDTILEEQIENLKSYQIEKNNKIKEMSIKYQKDILVETLIEVDAKFNRRDLKYKSENFVIKDKSNELIQAYKNLGVIENYNENKYRKKINDNLQTVNNVLKNLKDREFKGIMIQDVVVLSLYEKLNQVVDLSERFKIETENELSSLRDFTKIINDDFYINKSVEINYSGDLKIYLEDKKEINVKDLSSGEKQILTILIESLLQRGMPNIFIADEPEISLHISWQSKIISSIKKLNKKAQVIIATHSPEVAGSYLSKIIDMKEAAE